MNIHRLKARSDNYIFVLHNPQQGIAAVVDPTEAGVVLQTLAQLKATLVALFITHHHHDHVGGNLELLRHFPNAIIYASAADQGRIPGQTAFLKDGDSVFFGVRKAGVLFVPGHTSGHIVYYFPAPVPAAPGDLFCGDTLFSGGCGRLREGNPAQMMTSLSRIRNLPDHTRIWCAHEYTLDNLKFAMTVDPQNPQLQQRLVEVQALRQRQEATIPSWLSLEKQTNPFLRWDTPVLMDATGTQDAVKSFARLRRMKDQF